MAYFVFGLGVVVSWGLGSGRCVSVCVCVYSYLGSLGVG